MPNSTQNTWKPRLNPRLQTIVHQIAVRRGISDASALAGIIQAGIAAMSELSVVPEPGASSPAPSASASTTATAS